MTCSVFSWTRTVTFWGPHSSFTCRTPQSERYSLTYGCRQSVLWQSICFNEFILFCSGAEHLRDKVCTCDPKVFLGKGKLKRLVVFQIHVASPYFGSSLISFPDFHSSIFFSFLLSFFTKVLLISTVRLLFCQLFSLLLFHLHSHPASNAYL